MLAQKIVVDRMCAHLRSEDKVDESLAKHKHPPKRPVCASASPDSVAHMLALDQSREACYVWEYVCVARGSTKSKIPVQQQ